MITPEQAKQAAVEMRRFVKQIEAVMNKLDTTSQPCDCCGTIRWNNWKANQLWLKMEGLAERTEVVASALAKGANDPEFLGIEKVKVTSNREGA